MNGRAKSARQEVMLHMTNVVPARQEFRQFCAEVTYSLAGT